MCSGCKRVYSRSDNLITHQKTCKGKYNIFIVLIKHFLFIDFIIKSKEEKMGPCSVVLFRLPPNPTSTQASYSKM
jgi:hypothetical protein